MLLCVFLALDRAESVWLAVDAASLAHVPSVADGHHLRSLSHIPLLCLNHISHALLYQEVQVYIITFVCLFFSLTMRLIIIK